MNAAHVPTVSRTNAIVLAIALVVAAATLVAATALLSSDDRPVGTRGVPAGQPGEEGDYQGDWKDLLIEPGPTGGAAEVEGQPRSGRLP